MIGRVLAIYFAGDARANHGMNQPPEEIEVEMLASSGDPMLP